jgi:hypothetical protein
MNRKICYQGPGQPGAGSVEGGDDMKVLAKGLLLAGMAASVGIGLGSRPGLAHNDWGLPLVGGLVGGYALSSLMHQREGRSRERVVEQPVYAAPAPVYAAPAAPAAPSAATIEHQLNVLDQLAAKGYITQSEYQARRQALLNEL